MNLIFIGPAGSGKSTLVKSFSKYLKEMDYDVKAVNLDPASPPPYNAFKDIRDFIKTEEIMKKECLGINGSLVKSIDIALNFVTEILTSADYVLYDTPGQMELFLYLKSGIEIVNILSKSDTSVCIFVVDSDVVKTPENFVSVLAQNAVVSLNMDIPVITVFNKVDITKPPSLSEVKSGLSKGGVLAELMEKLLEFLEVTTVKYRTIYVSALKNWGFDDLISAINETFCSCGDLS